MGERAERLRWKGEIWGIKVINAFHTWLVSEALIISLIYECSAAAKNNMISANG